MYANTCWGLLGLAVAFGLAVLGLPTQYEWLSPWFLGTAVACGVGSIICFGWPLRQKDNRVKVAALISHPIRVLPLIEPIHIITLGLAIALGGVVWQWRTAHSAQTTKVDSAIQTTPGIGAPPDATIKTIQWNQIFGTTRAIDRVFVLFLDGHGPSSKSIKLKRAYLESPRTGEVIEMRVAGETMIDETFPVSETNPIPPNGFVRLVAIMNQTDIPGGTQNGLSNRDFIDRWGKIWFNAIYDDGNPPDRISFDTTGYFPEITGPHVTRRSPALLATPVTSQPKSQIPSYTTRTVRELRAFYEGRTRLQADAFMADEKGKLIETEGTVINIDNGMALLEVGKEQHGGMPDNIECRFSSKWNPKLGTYAAGAFMKIQGTIGPSQNGAQIYLQDCEIIS
jgi:hypothetical protein